MAGTGGCGYEHDVSTERFDDLPGETWDCPHPAEAGADRCQFHRHPSAVDDEHVASLLLERAGDGVADTNRFLGARFGDLDLRYAVVEGETNRPIDMRDCAVEGDLVLAEARVAQSLLLDGTAVVGSCSFEATTFGGRVVLREGWVGGGVAAEEATFARRFDLEGTVVDGLADLRLVAFESWAHFAHTSFRGRVYARNARFHKGVYAVRARFHRGADLLNATFDKVGNFDRATFEAGANFGSVDCLNDLSFEAATLAGPIDLHESRASGEIPEERRGFDGVAWLQGADVGGELRFGDATVEGDVRLREATVGRIDLSPVGDDAGATGEQTVVDLRAARVDGGRLAVPSADWVYDLAGATVGDVELTAVEGVDLFGAVRVLDTSFDGFDFGAPTHRRSLARNDWRLHDPGSTSWAALENTYLKAKNGASQTGASHAAAEFFRKEMAARRKHNWHLAFADGFSPLALGRWAANGALSVSSGYGERPSRTVLCAGGTVLVFALAYALTLGSGPSLDRYGAYLLFSFQSFITFLIGPPPAGNAAVVRALSAIEGFVGAFLIALFVFTLTRSVHR